jgi:murein L,D-transpeptidase YcbB/YkuD
VPFNHDAADTYDPQLEQAVINFQAHHGIQADGIVGPDTVAALNITIGKRIDQIRVNMERLRWVTRGLPQDYLLVDIAGYRALLYQDGQQTWSTRAIVGTPDRKTPVFRSMMSYLVLNPTWTVPQTILREDILPVVKKNPAALGDKGLKVIDSNGREVDPASVDWNMFSVSASGCKILQPPGPGNSLGQVKFIFPNKYQVYIHDTPVKPLFNKAERAFSSGCVRIEHPLELAERLLASNTGLGREWLRKQVASKQTQAIKLPRPIPVLLLYYTAEAGDDGMIYFRNDLYRRDRTVLQALDAEVGFFPGIDNITWKN